MLATHPNSEEINSTLSDTALAGNASIAHDILSHYQQVPYHNQRHALDVLSHVKKLGHGKDVATCMAALGHDTDHNWSSKAPEDEERSADITVKIAKDHLYHELEDRIRSMILGTIFRDRNKLLTDEQKIIADADVLGVGGDFGLHMIWLIRLNIETSVAANLPINKESLLESVGKNEGFYDFLVSVSGDDNTPFLTEEAQKSAPHFLRNRELFSRRNPDEVIRIFEKEWKQFFGHEIILK